MLGDSIVVVDIPWPCMFLLSQLLSLRAGASMKGAKTVAETRRVAMTSSRWMAKMGESNSAAKEALVWLKMHGDGDGRVRSLFNKVCDMFVQLLAWQVLKDKKLEPDWKSRGPRTIQLHALAGKSAWFFQNPGPNRLQIADSCIELFGSITWGPQLWGNLLDNYSYSNARGLSLWQILERSKLGSTICFARWFQNGWDRLVLRSSSVTDTTSSITTRTKLHKLSPRPWLRWLVFKPFRDACFWNSSLRGPWHPVPPCSQSLRCSCSAGRFLSTLSVRRCGVFDVVFWYFVILRGQIDLCEGSSCWQLLTLLLPSRPSKLPQVLRPCDRAWPHPFQS